VRVIAQLRFPPIVSIEKREFVAPFQEALRQSYPILRPDQIQEFILGANGIASITPQVVWRFSDVAGHWRVSLAPEFIALETTSYSSRGDFLGRLRGILHALGEHIGLAASDRFGLRYIDRVTGPTVHDMGQLVRKEVLGIAGTPLASKAQHLLSQALFELEGAQISMRWGWISPGSTVDPAAIEPLPERSWILDLDMFRAGARSFDVDELLVEARHYAERLYALFRWTVNEEFLRRYGGSV
jgi:uncharacterized protein (TIGR04255 family)